MVKLIKLSERIVKLNKDIKQLKEVYHHTAKYLDFLSQLSDDDFFSIKFAAHEVYNSVGDRIQDLSDSLQEALVEMEKVLEEAKDEIVKHYSSHACGEEKVKYDDGIVLCEDCGEILAGEVIHLPY